MDFFVTHMYVSHTLSTLQHTAMNNMKTDLVLKKYDGILINVWLKYSMRT